MPGLATTSVLFLILNSLYDFTAKLGGQIGLGKVTLLNKLLQMGSTFALAAFAWVFFRAASFTGAVAIIKNGVQILKAQLGLYMLGADAYNFVLCFVLILFMQLIHFALRHGNINYTLTGKLLLCAGSCTWGLLF